MTISADGKKILPGVGSFCRFGVNIETALAQINGQTLLYPGTE
jgi:hypothetical protein